MRRRAGFLLPFIVFLFYASSSPAFSQITEAGEYEVKAAFVYNIAKFVEWPRLSQDEGLRLCILGEGRFKKAFTSLEGKMVRGKPLKVEPATLPAGFKNCSILFISSSQKSSFREIAEASKGLSILTVGDTGGFTGTGVMVNLYVTGEEKVRFDINAKAAEEAGLKISSKLLRLAGAGRRGKAE